MTRIGWHTLQRHSLARRQVSGAALVLWTCAALASAAWGQGPTRLPPLDVPLPPPVVAVPGPALGPAPAGAPIAEARLAAPPADNVDLETKLRERGDLVLSDTTLRQALFTISESWHINLVVGEDVSGQVNGNFKNAPLHEILHSLLFANGYGYRVVGQGLVVMKLDTLGDSNPLFVTDAILLRSLKPEDVVEGANLLRSPQGKITAIPAARTLMVVDLPERILAIRNFVRQLDDSTAASAGPAAGGMERQVAQFTPQFVKALTLKESLEAILSKDGKAIIIEDENRAIVVDYPPNLALAERVMRDLDIARPQVRITAMIYDISLEDLERLGINWHHAVKGNSLTAEGTPDAMWAVDSLTTVPVSAGTPAASMTFMSLSRNFDIGATLNALCQAKDAQLLADPSVTVVDREPATIQIVTEIPYQQLTQTQQGGNIGTTAFREAGVTLKVIPFISSDNTVQMVVTPTFSRLTGFTNGGNPQPIIDKRQAETTVRVLNQQWLVIGGLRQRTAVKDDRAVPGLSAIKGLGKLFKSYDYSFRESELVVFLMPELVTPAYRGREREQVVEKAAEGWLDETPVAPTILGQGTVGCPNCGKVGCKGCGKHWQPWQPDPREPTAQSENLPPGAVVVDDRPAIPPPSSTRRLPQVQSERPAAPAATPATTRARPTAAAPASRKGPALPSQVAGAPPAPQRTPATSRGGMSQPPLAPAMQQPQGLATQSNSAIAPKQTATKSSGNWFTSWWK